jgi:hypothetical protein
VQVTLEAREDQDLKHDNECASAALTHQCTEFEALQSTSRLLSFVMPPARTLRLALRRLRLATFSERFYRFKTFKWQRLSKAFFYVFWN